MLKFKKYYLFIDNSSNINFSDLKINHKFSIIYRDNCKKENFYHINKIRNICKLKRAKFYVANNIMLATKIKADGLYISAWNHKPYFSTNFVFKKNIIGSCHNYRDLNHKLKQGCSLLILSRIFKTGYENKKNFLGIIRFNLFTQKFKKPFTALGGIKKNNIKSCQLLNCFGIALYSEIKKKPVKFFNRLF